MKKKLVDKEFVKNRLKTKQKLQLYLKSNKFFTFQSNCSPEEKFSKDESGSCNYKFLKIVVTLAARVLPYYTLGLLRIEDTQGIKFCICKKNWIHALFVCFAL